MGYGGAQLLLPFTSSTAGEVSKHLYIGSANQRMVAWISNTSPGYIWTLVDGNIDNTNSFRYQRYVCQESPSGSGNYGEVLSYNGTGFNMRYNSTYNIFYREDFLNYNLGSITGIPDELQFTWTGSYDDLCAAAYNYFYPPVIDQPIYVGVNGKAREVTDMYVGVNGKARKVTAIYAGVNGKARKVYESS